MSRVGAQALMSITVIGIVPLLSDVNGSFVLPEYLLAPPDAEEKPLVIKEPRNWFWQRKKKEEDKMSN